MNTFHNTFFAMGTRFDVVIPNEETVLCESVYNQIQQKTLGLEAKLSYYDPQSTVSRINREADKKPLRIDEQTFRAIDIALNYHRLTNGAFDICKAALKHGIEVKLEVDAKANSLVSANDSALGIVLNKDEQTIFFRWPGLKIDLGGIGKGLAMESAKIIMEQAGIKNALLSFGESSVLGIGKHPKGDCWKVGIPNAGELNKFLHHFQLRDEALSISGNLHRNDDGSVSEINHIIDPQTNLLVKKNKLVSVRSASPLEAEVLSTALFVVGEDGAAAIANNFKQVEYVFLA